MLRTAAFALAALTCLVAAPATSFAGNCKQTLEIRNDSGQDVFAGYVGVRLREKRHSVDFIKHSDGQGKDFRINDGETTSYSFKTKNNCKWKRKFKIKFWCTTGDKSKNKNLKSSGWIKFDRGSKGNKRTFSINLTSKIKQKCQ